MDGKIAVNGKGVSSRVAPCLWFDSQAEDAANFYVSCFANSGVDRIRHYGAAGAEASGRPEGSVMVVDFRLADQRFIAMNGGPGFPFSWAVSFTIFCDSQADIDSYWEKLSAGGKPMPCGWITDKFDMSWQVVPSVMEKLMEGDDGSADRVFAALMKMKKIDVAELQRAYDEG